MTDSDRFEAIANWIFPVLESLAGRQEMSDVQQFETLQLAYHTAMERHEEITD